MARVLKKDFNINKFRHLCKLYQERKMTPSEICRIANIDMRSFSMYYERHYKYFKGGVK